MGKHDIVYTQVGEYSCLDPVSQAEEAEELEAWAARFGCHMFAWDAELYIKGARRSVWDAIHDELGIDLPDWPHPIFEAGEYIDLPHD